jgi:carbonic anhydrase
VSPERIFDAGMGEIFVARVAGSTLSPEAAGGIHYAVSHMRTRSSGRSTK